MKLLLTIRDALIGLILFLIAMYLVSCGTPTAFDPNLSAVQAELTAQAAQNQAQLYSAMATSTAQAPIVHITETAAAISFVNTQLSTDRTSTAMAWTPTPIPTSTIVPSPTANAEMTATFSALFAQQTQTVLDTQRAETNNMIRAIFWYGAGIVALFLLVPLVFTLIKKLAFIPQPIHESGKPQPLINVVEGIVIDTDKMANGIGQFKEKFIKFLPPITANRQAEVTALSQKVDMATRARLPMSLLKKLDELESHQIPALPAPEDDEDPILIDYPLPEWHDWMQNWKPGHLALGINENGLLQVDPEANSHFLFAGTTGSGKTRSGVRVLITCALASGWQVIIAGKDLDYKVFEHHPNTYMVPFSLLTDPTRAIDLLRSVYGEIERRTRMMSRSNYGLWRETGQSRTMVVVDEFSNLADALEDIDRSRRDELWRWARMDTAEARKYGIHMVYALQDPTARSIDIRIRRNTTPIVFRVKDAASSRTVLNVNGAEMLSIRHFLANIVRIERGAAFAPSDVEIMDFLNSHPVQTAEEPAWVEGVLISDYELQNGKQDLIEGPAETHGQKPAESIGDWLHSLDTKQGEALNLHISGGMSYSHIAEKVYGHSNGRTVRAVKALIEEWKRRNQGTTTTTTTTATTPKIPEMGTAAA